MSRLSAMSRWDAESCAAQVAMDSSARAGGNLQVRAQEIDDALDQSMGPPGCRHAGARALSSPVALALRPRPPGFREHHIRETLKTPTPRPVKQALTLAARSPPWVPRPGTRKISSGRTFRTSASSDGRVAPVTAPMLPLVFHSLTFRATPEVQGAVSGVGRLEVSRTGVGGQDEDEDTLVPVDRKGSTLSRPM